MKRDKRGVVLVLIGIVIGWLLGGGPGVQASPPAQGVGRVQLTVPVGGAAHLECLPGSGIVLNQVAPRAGEMFCQPLTK